MSQRVFPSLHGRVARAVAIVVAIAVSLGSARVAAAQPTLRLPLSVTPPTGDSVVARLYDEGTRRSQLVPLASALVDSIGPRLTGSPANRAANEWLVRTYSAWGCRRATSGTARGATGRAGRAGWSS